MGFFGSSKGSEVQSVRGANGATLSTGQRVQTINDEGRDADHLW